MNYFDRGARASALEVREVAGVWGVYRPGEPEPVVTSKDERAARHDRDNLLRRSAIGIPLREHRTKGEA